jgi:hypothetical protein
LVDYLLKDWLYKYSNYCQMSFSMYKM